MTIRMVAGAGLAVALLVGGCQARRSAWNQTLADTDCHAANVIIKKGDAGQLKVTACGETRIYDCPDGGECALASGGGTPDAADPTAPIAEDTPPPTSTDEAVEPESTDDDVTEASDEPADEPSEDEAADDEAADEGDADEASDEP